MIKSTSEFADDYTLIEYEFSTLCDKSCSYCYNMYDHDHRFAMPHDEIIKDLTAILSADNEKLALVLIGGEIMLYPRFTEVVEHIAKHKKPNTKIILFTHADYPEEKFKQKIDQLKVFGDNVKITCTIHWEDLNRTQFKNNVKYINDNFKHKAMYFLLTDKFFEESVYVDSILEESDELRIYGLMFDGSEGLTLIKQVNMFNKLEKYSDRMDNYIQIGDDIVPHNHGMNRLYKETRYSFEGDKCTLVDYDVDKVGNVRMCCSGEILFNLRDGYTTDMFDKKTITCTQKRCMQNLGNLLVHES